MCVCVCVVCEEKGGREADTEREREGDGEEIISEVHFSSHSPFPTNWVQSANWVFSLELASL